MGPHFGSSNVIWPEALPRAISHPQTQNPIPYTAYIPTTIHVDWETFMVK